MIRVLIFLVIVLLLAFGGSWMADHPGTIDVTFAGREVQTSTLVGLVAIVVAAFVLILIWSALRFVFRIPSLMSMASATRRRQRGYAALSRGMVAVGSGDAEVARRHASEASRLLRNEPMALLLRAQAAQLSGDRTGAEETFTTMLGHADTRALALRGLYMEAVRRNDSVAALAHAEAAQKLATLPWAASAVLQARAAAGDWPGALSAIERNMGARVVDRLTGNRQKAVVLTAMAQEANARSPDEALNLAKEALKLAPTLVPAAALAGRLLARKGDIRKAAKIIETAFAETPHPDLADAFVHARVGDSALDRLQRAETLARCAPETPESRLMVARAALEAREFELARSTMAPLVSADATTRPTRRMCLVMADIEEAEHGETGALFEWLQRASRGARDPAWIADGTVAEDWAPVSPVTGRLDAFVWESPKDQLSADHDRDLVPSRPERTSVAALANGAGHAPAPIPVDDGEASQPVRH